MNKIEERLQEYRRRKQAEYEAEKAKQEAEEAARPKPPQPRELNRVDFFAIDVLNFYPFRKWREWCAAHPFQCWASTLCFWLAGQILAASAQFGLVYLLFSLLLAMFLNLGSRREGELSAYSVFNPGCTRLLGQMTSEHFERDMLMQRRGGTGTGAEDEDE